MIWRKGLYKNYLADQGFNPFKIICADDEEIMVNPIVMAQNSCVFDTMFRSGMSETKQNEMKLCDIDGKTMKEFVKFVYSAKISNLKELVFSLLYASEKYQVDKLKEICIVMMKDQLKVENVLETLNAAIVYRIKDLRRQCIEFIKLKFDELKDDESFNNLPNDLKEEIIKDKDSIIIVYPKILGLYSSDNPEAD